MGNTFEQTNIPDGRLQVDRNKNPKKTLFRLKVLIHRSSSLLVQFFFQNAEKLILIKQSSARYIFFRFSTFKVKPNFYGLSVDVDWNAFDLNGKKV
jgi:hypothetical protein